MGYCEGIVFSEKKKKLEQDYKITRVISYDALP